MCRGVEEWVLWQNGMVGLCTHLMHGYTNSLSLILFVVLHCTIPVHTPKIPHPAPPPAPPNPAQDGSSVWVDRLAKVNVNTGAVNTWQEPNCYPGEPLFVATPDGAAEDDGVLLSVVLDGMCVDDGVVLCMCCAR